MALSYTIGIIFGIVVVIALFGVIIQSFFPEGPFFGPRRFNVVVEFIETFVFLKFILTAINAVLLTYLLYNYLTIYEEIRSHFSMGLIVTAVALLAHAILSNPVISQLFGFRGNSMGVFDVIPSFFTLIAALVLIHLSRQ